MRRRPSAQNHSMGESPRKEKNRKQLFLTRKPSSYCVYSALENEKSNLADVMNDVVVVVLGSDSCEISQGTQEGGRLNVRKR
jgi:hypothetical protein